MSIEGKHSYRFGYLKSEQWSNVRLAALAREKARCQICGEESLSNDAHHVWYPQNIYETREQDLVILCRACHDFIHEMVPECKTGNEEYGHTQWRKFKNAIIEWRRHKIAIFQYGDDVPVNAHELRLAYVGLKQRLLATGSFETISNVPIKDQIAFVVSLVKSWGKIAQDYERNVNSSVAESDFQI